LNQLISEQVNADWLGAPRLQTVRTIDVCGIIILGAHLMHQVTS